ncbi:MAG: efflux RND transporter periplasmic adaptor subunit [Acidobacteriota bacterium]
MHAKRELLVVAFIAASLALTAGCDRKPGQDGHEGHDEAGHHEEGEAHEGEARELSLSPEQVSLVEGKSVVVTKGTFPVVLSLPAEITVADDHVAHLVPRVPGVVRQVRRTLGDTVKAGEVLAVIESRELADARADYLAAKEKSALARLSFDREAGLWERRITSEQEYLEAKQASAEAAIALRSAEQKLRALVGDLAVADDAAGLTAYEIRAPRDGTIIERHITEGEVVGDEAVYTVANLDHVWAIASVYEKDIRRVAVGQTAMIALKAYPDETHEGRVTWVSDTLDEETRTQKLRVEIPNADRKLKPGMFGNVALQISQRDDALTVPASAVQTHEGETIVFVEGQPGRYARRDVELGSRTAAAVEVLKGLEPGERVVTEGSFLLKSELEKAGFEAGHAH